MRALFTIPDPTLTQESSVDPLGLQVIWVGLGQAIFGDRLTTIANNPRIFTFNLIHNHIIYRLYQEQPELIQSAKTRYRQWQTDFDVKSGLIIFLEDLATHAFYQKYQHEDNARGLGILGINKARRLYLGQEVDTIRLEAVKNKGLLTRQLTLGMSGRYKGPMMEMDFFDRSLSYNTQTWEQAERVIQKWDAVMELEKNALALIAKRLLLSRTKEYPVLSMQEIKSSPNWKAIQDKYDDSLGGKKLPAPIRKFWIDKMNLHSGAPAALLQTIQQKEVDTANKLYRKSASLLKNEPSELEKVLHILAVEPFLSHTEYLVRYLSQADKKTLKDEKDGLAKLRNAIEQSALFDASYRTGRLGEMYPVFVNDHPMHEWVDGILRYHEKIMNMRGGHAWLAINSKGVLKHQFSMSLLESTSTIDKYLHEQPWLHTYYFESLNLISQYLN